MSKFQKVFICSRLRSDKLNEEEMFKAQCREYCRYAANQGLLPIAPHIYFTQFMNDHDRDERCMGINFGLELLKECDEVWVFTNNDYIGEGMKKEIELAQSLNIPIKYFKDFNY